MKMAKITYYTPFLDLLKQIYDIDIWLSGSQPDVNVINPTNFNKECAVLFIIKYLNPILPRKLNLLYLFHQEKAEWVDPNNFFQCVPV